MRSVNTARLVKFGSKFFGERSWYSGNVDVSSKIQSLEDRRRFRFGLKCNVDFLIQLDLENVIDLLNQKQAKSDPVDEAIPHSDECSNTQLLSDGSFFDLMRQI